MAAYHKAPREYLGVQVPVITDMATRWRAGLDVAGRVALAEALWRTDIHEARVAAAKLLTQARIRDDEAVWRLIASWVPAVRRLGAGRPCLRCGAQAAGGGPVAD